MKLTKRYGVGVFLLAFAGLACSGGGGDDSGRPPRPVPDGGGSSVSATFVPDQLVADARDVTLKIDSANGRVVALQVNITAVQDVYSAGFDITYDPNRVEFTNWLPGNLFEFDGNTPLYTVQSISGRITVGVTRSGAVQGVTVGVPRTFIKLVFTLTDDRDSRLDFENAFLLDSQPPSPSAIDGIEWHGGRFDVDPSN